MKNQPMKAASVNAERSQKFYNEHDSHQYEHRRPELSIS